MRKAVPGFSNYEITDDGRVWSKPRVDRLGRLVQGKWLCPNRVGVGYLIVELWRGCQPHRLYLHRLVLEAFVGPCPAGMEACHFPDRDKANNRLTNLRWDTRSENNRDAVKHGTRGGATSISAKLTDQAVRQIIRTWRAGLNTQAELAKQYGVSFQLVSDIVNRKRWKHVWVD